MGYTACADTIGDFASETFALVREEGVDVNILISCEGFGNYATMTRMTNS